MSIKNYESNYEAVVLANGSLTNNYPSRHFGSITGVTAIAGGSGTATFVNFFNKANERGELKIYAFSPTLGTVKLYLGGYQARVTNTTHALSVVSGSASVELGNGGTGGSAITIARSNLDLVVTVDFTDGANVAVNDGEVHIYISNAF